MSVAQVQPLVFTDLDGSLLDHHSYSFDAARSTLERLDELGIPVIPVTSKTRAEIKQIRDALGNKHPFVAENGAAVFIPRSYFPEPPEGTLAARNAALLQATGNGKNPIA